MGDKVKRGITRLLVKHFTDNPGKVISVEELEKLFPDWNRATIMQTCSNLMNPRHDREPGRQSHLPSLERLKVGLYRYNVPVEADKNGEPQQPEGDEYMLVEILRERENFLIVEGTKDQKIYKMYLVG